MELEYLILLEDSVGEDVVGPVASSTVTDDADVPSVEEPERLYSSLETDDRDQLLEELLVAAAHGGDATVAVVDAWLVDRAGREFLRGVD